MFEKEKKDRIIYYTCGHSSDGGTINLDEQNQAEVLEIIEKGIALALGRDCPKCLERERNAQTFRILQQTGILTD